MGRALQVGQGSSAFTCMCHSQEFGGGGNTLSKVFAISKVGTLCVPMVLHGHTNLQQRLSQPSFTTTALSRWLLIESTTPLN